MEILKGLQFRQVEESEFNNLFHDHIQAEDENAEDVQMAYHLRPMEKLLRIRIVCIENAIVVLAILVDEFELKTELLDFVSNNSFFGLENDDPHSHIRRFYQITRTLKLNQVLDDVVKLILFLFSLKGAAETWLENEPSNSITSWDDLVSKPSCVLPSNIDPSAELNVITSMDGLTLDVSFIPHYNLLVYQEKEQEPETITEVVGIASSKSTPLVLPLETPPLSTPKQKENLEHNPHQLLLKKENFQALNNPTGRVGH
ncbi:hypothetical protein Tco_0589871 [Tanacetum coccineum]